jgi:hypothetical protein
MQSALERYSCAEIVRARERPAQRAVRAAPAICRVSASLMQPRAGCPRFSGVCKEGRAGSARKSTARTARQGTAVVGEVPLGERGAKTQVKAVDDADADANAPADGAFAEATHVGVSARRTSRCVYGSLAARGAKRR